MSSFSKLPITPRKSYGQNFLISPAEIQRIAAFFTWKPETIVLEIGPGLGALTDYLLHSATQLFAVEKDQKIYEILSQKHTSTANLKLFNCDILKFDPAQCLTGQKAVVVGNLPFSHCVPILKWCLNNSQHFPELYLSFPHSIAAKIVSSKKNNPLQALTSLHYKVKTLTNVAPEHFAPRPKIVTTFLHFTRSQPPRDFKNVHQFETFLYDVFAQKRKKLLNNPTLQERMSEKDLINFFSAHNLPLDTRAEEMSLELLLLLFEKVNFYRNNEPL